MLILFNKPFDVLCQFSAVPGRRTLKTFIELSDVYPAGRLDADSEGLLALTDDGLLQHEISDPAGKLPKTYWAQVEGVATADAARQLASGVEFEGRRSRPASVELTVEPEWLWPRVPPIRHRVNVPTSWLRISITEGRNRQVRKMTAAVGLPTLRLIRFAIGPWTLTGLEPGQWRMVSLAIGEPDANRIGEGPFLAPGTRKH